MATQSVDKSLRTQLDFRNCFATAEKYTPKTKKTPRRWAIARPRFQDLGFGGPGNEVGDPWRHSLECRIKLIV